MSNYTKTTNFATKDSLASGNPNKIVKGTEINSEFDNIATAVATKANTASPSLTGTVTAAALNVTGNLDVDGTLEFDSISGTGSVAVTDIADEDNMSSDSATKLATQQSIKAYVDSQVTAQDLDLTDGSTSISIDLDSEALSVLGGTGVTSTASGNGVTLAIDSTVTTLTGSQTLTNKTLTSPDVNTPDIDGGTIDGTVIGGATAAAGSFTTVGATGNITVGGTVDGRDVATDGSKLDGIEASATADQSNAEIRTAVEAASDSNVFTDADHTKLNAIEASADVTDTANVTAAGALMDSELTAIASVKALNQGVATGDSPSFVGLTTSGEITANGGIALGDSDKATFGASDDLQIYHDGGNSRILENGTGFLAIGTNGGEISLRGDSFNDYMVKAEQNSAVTLYHDALPKLATTSTGIDVTGNVVADGLTVDGNVTFNTDTFKISDNIPKLVFEDTDTSTLASITANSSNITYDTVATSRDHIFKQGGTTRMVIDDTGIDVTGTATMDGLTVDGTINAYRAGFTQGVQLIGDSGGNQIIGTATNDKKLIIKNQAATQGIELVAGNKAINIAHNGDISFYEDTGTTPKFFWDASAESLGIGTSSPTTALDFGSDYYSGTPSTIEQLINKVALYTDGSGPKYGLGISDGALNITAGTGAIRLHTNGANERFRISSDGSCRWTPDGTTPDMTLTADGNLLVGKTSDAYNTVGVQLLSTGRVYATATGVAPIFSNRKGGDGSVMDFAKDGSPVGSIGTVGADVTIGTGDTGLRFRDEFDTIQPHNITTNGTVDGVISLGKTGARFKDLYLSGGVLAGSATSHNISTASNFSAASSDIQLTLERTGTSAGWGGIGSNGDNAFHVYNSSTQKVIQFEDGNGSISFPQSGGGIYLGGTGAANKLDDYEEGTWTPTVYASDGTTVLTLGTDYATRTAAYTKIGQLVRLSIRIEDLRATKENLWFTVPFTSLENDTVVGSILPSVQLTPSSYGTASIYATYTKFRLTKGAYRYPYGSCSYTTNS